MLNKLKNLKGSSGFTIIEVMIVLAIAGLIMLIVFLAVPALQRNAHNTSIKNDVASLMAGMNEYTNNNNGTPPTSLANKATTSLDIAGGSGSNDAKVKIGYVDGSQDISLSSLSGTASAPTTPAVVHLYTNAVCNGTSTATASGATSRSYVALYSLEGGAKLCQES